MHARTHAVAPAASAAQDHRGGAKNLQGELLEVGQEGDGLGHDAREGIVVQAQDEQRVHVADVAGDAPGQVVSADVEHLREPQ